MAITALLATTVGLMVACAATPTESRFQPPWFERNSGAYDTEQGKLFFGIGTADQLKNRSLQRVNADNHARHQMGRVLEQYSKALAVTATQTGDLGLKTMPEVQVQAALNSLVRQAMRLAIVSDHWVNPESGQMMALCTLDLEQYKAVLSEHKTLDTRLRSAMHGYADMLHARLAEDFQNN
jgi:hypothetical protein